MYLKCLFLVWGLSRHFLHDFHVFWRNICVIQSPDFLPTLKVCAYTFNSIFKLKRNSGGNIMIIWSWKWKGERPCICKISGAMMNSRGRGAEMRNISWPVLHVYWTQSMFLLKFAIKHNLQVKLLATTVEKKRRSRFEWNKWNDAKAIKSKSNGRRQAADWMPKKKLIDFSTKYEETFIIRQHEMIFFSAFCLF